MFNNQSKGRLNHLKIIYLTGFLLPRGSSHTEIRLDVEGVRIGWRLVATGLKTAQRGNHSAVIGTKFRIGVGNWDWQAFGHLPTQFLASRHTTGNDHRPRLELPKSPDRFIDNRFHSNTLEAGGNIGLLGFREASWQVFGREREIFSNLRLSQPQNGCFEPGKRKIICRL